MVKVSGALPWQGSGLGPANIPTPPRGWEGLMEAEHPCMKRQRPRNFTVVARAQ